MEGDGSKDLGQGGLGHSRYPRSRSPPWARMVIAFSLAIESVDVRSWSVLSSMILRRALSCQSLRCVLLLVAVHGPRFGPSAAQTRRGQVRPGWSTLPRPTPVADLAVASQELPRSPCLRKASATALTSRVTSAGVRSSTQTRDPANTTGNLDHAF